MHADVGKELLAGILQAGAKEIDLIVDNQETVVVMLADVDGDRRILLVVTLQVELLLLGELAGVDRCLDVGIAIAEHGQGVCADVIVDKHDRAFGLLDKADDLGISIEELAVVEDAFDWGQ